MSYVKKLHKKKLITPPKYVVKGIQLEIETGSVSYGVSTDISDIDIYGFCIPPKELIFPHLTGTIQGFGRQIQRFDQWQQHHIKDVSAQKDYDISIYNIVRFFQLCMDNNPNMIDSLFVPRRCVLFTTPIGERVRESRKLFLHKGSFHKYKGYAYSQLHKMKIKKPEGKRKKLIEKHGYDTKFGYHLVRLLNQSEQILMEGDLDLEKNREQLKSIRRGEWSISQLDEFFTQKEKDLESLYIKSTLRHSPDEEKIKQLLLECLEMYFGSLKDVVVFPSSTQNLIKDVEDILYKYKGI